MFSCNKPVRVTGYWTMTWEIWVWLFTMSWRIWASHSDLACSTSVSCGEDNVDCSRAIHASWAEWRKRWNINMTDRKPSPMLLSFTLHSSHCATRGDCMLPSPAPYATACWSSAFLVALCRYILSLCGQLWLVPTSFLIFPLLLTLLWNISMHSPRNPTLGDSVGTSTVFVFIKS